MQVYLSSEREFKVGDLVTHNRIGTLGIIVEIFSLNGTDFAKISYDSGVVRTDEIGDLLPTVDMIREGVKNEDG